jgi:hypothetical protein
MAHPSMSANSYVAYGLVAGAALGTLLLALTGSATWLAAMAGVGLLVGVLVGGWRDHRSWREPPRGTADPRQDG